MHDIDQATAEIIFHGLINKSGPPVVMVRDKFGQYTRSETGEAPGHLPWGEEDAGLPAWDKPLADVSALTTRTPAQAPSRPAVTPPVAAREPVARRSIERLASDFDRLWGQTAAPATPTRRRIQT